MEASAPVNDGVEQRLPCKPQSPDHGITARAFAASARFGLARHSQRPLSGWNSASLTQALTSGAESPLPGVKRHAGVPE